MNSMSDSIGIQLKTLLDSGISLEDACETLSLDIDGARAFLIAQEGEEISAEDFLKENKIIALRALLNIGLDTAIENVSARVSALKIIAEGAGELPQLPVDKYSEMFKKMKGVVGKYNNAGAKTQTTNLGTPEAEILAKAI